jgi:hypothetical protein
MLNISLEVVSKLPLRHNLFVGTRYSVHQWRIDPQKIIYIPPVENLVPP